MTKYTITSIDNATIGRGSGAVMRGEFEDADEAVERAQQLVNDALMEHFVDAADEHDLMARYMARGREVPMIYGEPRVSFRAYQYARQRTDELFAARRKANCGTSEASK